MLQLLPLLTLFFPSTYQVPKEGRQQYSYQDLQQPSIEEKILYPTMIAYDAGMRDSIPIDLLLLISHFSYGLKFKPIYQKKHLLSGIPFPIIALEKSSNTKILFWYAEATGKCLDRPSEYPNKRLAIIKAYNEAMAIEPHFLYNYHKKYLCQPKNQLKKIFKNYVVSKEHKCMACGICESHLVLTDIVNLYFCTKGWGTKEEVKAMCDNKEEIYYFFKAKHHPNHPLYKKSLFFSCLSSRKKPQ